MFILSLYSYSKLLLATGATFRKRCEKQSVATSSTKKKSSTLMPCPPENDRRCWNNKIKLVQHLGFSHLFRNVALVAM
jgi:hypothetical protein